MLDGHVALEPDRLQPPRSGLDLCYDPVPSSKSRHAPEFLVAMQAGGFVAKLDWDARAGQLRLMSGVFRMATYDVPAPHVEPRGDPDFVPSEGEPERETRHWVHLGSC